jgi:hypothetical protein
LTQLTFVGLRVKMLKCKLWSPSRISPGIEIPQGYTLVTNGLCILGVLMSFQDFVTRFYFKMWRISMIFLSWEMPKLFCAFCFHV